MAELTYNDWSFNQLKSLPHQLPILSQKDTIIWWELQKPDNPIEIAANLIQIFYEVKIENRMEGKYIFSIIRIKNFEKEILPKLRENFPELYEIATKKILVVKSNTFIERELKKR